MAKSSLQATPNQVARLRIFWGEYLYDTRTLSANRLENLTEGEILRLSAGNLSYTIDWVSPQVKLSKFDLLSFRNFSLSLLATLMACSFVFYGLDKIEIKAEKPSEEKNWVTLMAPPPEPEKVVVAPPVETAAPGEPALAPIKPSLDFKKAPLQLVESAPTKKSGLDLGDLKNSLSGIGSVNTKPQAVATSDSLGLGGLKLSPKMAPQKTEGLGKLVGQGKGTYSQLGTKDLGTDRSPTLENTDESGQGLESSEISAVVKSRESRIRNCFERQLHSRPNLSGKIMTRFTIGSTGKVTAAKITFDSLQHSATTSCVLAEIKTWVFPAPKGNSSVTVEHPFSFMVK